MASPARPPAVDPLLDVLDRVQGRAPAEDPLLSILDEVQGTSSGRPTSDATADTRSMFARIFDTVFTAPDFVTDAASRAANAIDQPTLDRSPLRAQLEGFAAGALQGASSLLTPGDVALTATGYGPLARIFRGIRGGAQAARGAQHAANVATVARGAERLADAESVSEGLAGAAQVALGGAGTLAGRRPAAPAPAPTPRPMLPAGPRFQVAPDGRVAPVGTDIPGAAVDPSFARGVPAEYARREISGLLPAGREPMITPPPPGSVPDGVDPSFVRGVPAELARREIRGALPPPARFVGTESGVAEAGTYRPSPSSTPGIVDARGTPRDGAGRVIPAAVVDFDATGAPIYSGDPSAVSVTRPVRGRLGPGARFTAGTGGRVAANTEQDALLALLDDVQHRPAAGADPSAVTSSRPAILERDIDASVPAAEGVRVRQYASDPSAMDAPMLSEAETHMLRLMREDLTQFVPQRGRLVRGPGEHAAATYAPGGPGSPVGDDVRIISEQHVGNDKVRDAIDDLLAGKQPTTRLHTAAIDAARGYLEGREGYRGPFLPMDPVDVPTSSLGGQPSPEMAEFEAFASAFDDVAPDPRGEPGEAGFITAQLAQHVAGGLGGAAVGAATGEDTEDRLRRGAIYGVLGAAAPAVFRRGGGPQRVPGILSQSPQRSTVPGIIAGGGNATPPRVPRSSRTVQGRPIPDPLADTDVFLSKFPAPVREGLRERLAANAGFAEQRRGVLPVEQQARLAERVSVDVSRNLPRGTALNTEQVMAYTRAVDRTARRVQELGAAVNRPTASDVDLLAFEAAKADHAAVLASLMGARAEAGRALAAFRFFNGVVESGDVNLIRAALKAPGLRSGAQEIASRIAALPNDPLARYDFLKGLGTPTLMDKARSVYYANILSGVKTHERNFLGNLANVVSNLAVQPVAAGIDAARSAVTGRPRTVRLDEFPAQVAGTLAGVDRGVRDFVFTLRHGISPDALSRSVSSAERHGKFDLPRVELGGGGANPFNWPGRLLDAADSLFRSIGRNQELYGAAFTKAKNEGLRGDRLTQRVADLRAGLTPDAQALHADAATYATRAVFQEPLGPVGGALQTLVRRVPAMSFVVPFIKTPTNILRQGLEFSPAGFGMQAARQGGRAGTQAQARAALGSVLLAPIAYLAATGRLSGAGPRDRSDREALMATGWRPNSVRIGDQWVSYQLFQPVSVPAAVVANGFDAWREAGARPEAADDAMGRIVETAFRSGRSLLDQSFLSGLYDFLEAVNDPQRFGSTWAGRLAHSATPFAGMQRTIQQGLDPVVRSPETVTDVIASNVPGASDTVRPRIDRFGEVVTREGGPARRALDPFNTSSVTDDPVSQELQRLNQAGFRIPLTVPTDAMTVRGQRIDLTQEQQVRLQQTKGRAVRAVLDRLVSAPGYTRLNDDARAQLIRRAIDDARREATQRQRQRVAQERR